MGEVPNPNPDIVRLSKKQVTNKQELSYHPFKKVKNIVGGSFIGVGCLLAVVGIGDFFTNYQVSNTLMQIHNPPAPEAITLFSHYLAEIPQALKTVGGASIIFAGRKLM